MVHGHSFDIAPPTSQLGNKPGGAREHDRRADAMEMAFHEINLEDSQSFLELTRQQDEVCGWWIG